MKKIFIAVFLVLLLTGCEGRKTMELGLKGNPTTGYEWSYTMSNDNIIKEVSSDYVASDSTLVGSGGIYKYVFDGLEKGEVTLTFVYERSFEEGVSPLYTLEYIIAVDNNKNLTLKNVTGNYSEDDLPKPTFKKSIKI